MDTRVPIPTFTYLLQDSTLARAQTEAEERPTQAAPLVSVLDQEVVVRPLLESRVERRVMVVAHTLHAHAAAWTLELLTPSTNRLLTVK